VCKFCRAPLFFSSLAERDVFFDVQACLRLSLSSLFRFLDSTSSLREWLFFGFFSPVLPTAIATYPHLIPDLQLFFFLVAFLVTFFRALHSEFSLGSGIGREALPFPPIPAGGIPSVFLLLSVGGGGCVVGGPVGMSLWRRGPARGGGCGVGTP